MPPPARSSKGRGAGRASREETRNERASPRPAGHGGGTDPDCRSYAGGVERIKTRSALCRRAKSPGRAAARGSRLSAPGKAPVAAASRDSSGGERPVERLLRGRALALPPHRGEQRGAAGDTALPPGHPEQEGWQVPWRSR